MLSMVAYSQNPKTKEAELMQERPAWATHQVLSQLKLHGEEYLISRKEQEREGKEEEEEGVMEGSRERKEREQIDISIGVHQKF